MKKSHIAAVLETIEADQLNMLDEEFRGLVKAVDKTGKHGIYTLKLKIGKSSTDQVLVTVESAAKIPKGLSPVKTLYIAFDDLNQTTGELSTQRTRQPDLPFDDSKITPLRSAGK